jgi:hypothetical protein
MTTKIEKQTDKIVESLGPRELMLVRIAQALAFDSDTEWFAARDQHQDESSAETERVHSAFKKKINRRFLPVVADQKIRDALFESQFLWRLWSDCNLYVQDVNERILSRLALSAANQESIVLGKSESLDYGSDVKDLLLEVFRTQQAIAAIRDRYFEGCPILFKEDNVKLGVLIAEGEEMAHWFNKILDGIERAGRLRHLSKAGQGLPSKLDVDEVKLAAAKSSNDLVDSLIRTAKFRARVDRAIATLISELKGNRL